MDIYILFLGALLHTVVTLKPSEALKNFKVELSNENDSSKQAFIIKSKGAKFFLFCFGFPMLSYFVINSLISYLFSDVSLPNKFTETLWWVSIIAITCYIAWAIRDVLFKKISIVGIALFIIILLGLVNLPQQALFILVFIGLLRKPVSWLLSKII